MPNDYQGSLVERWFLPHQETQVVAQTASKGIFLPYPLLAILVTVGALVLSGIVGLYVQVSSLSTTLLLRDSDHARQIMEIKTELTKETERRELTDLKVADLREKQAAKGRN
jgi:hypothetical protein